MLSIKDIVDLAKAGYKPADVKELIEISKSNGDKKDQEPAAESSDTFVPNAITPNGNSDEAAGTPDPKESDIDYKALYESTKLELDKAQKENIKKDISSEEDDLSDTDILKDLFKEFM